jgi:hypothetical protein
MHNLVVVMRYGIFLAFPCGRSQQTTLCNALIVYVRLRASAVAVSLIRSAGANINSNGKIAEFRSDL